MIDVRKLCHVVLREIFQRTPPLSECDVMAIEMLPECDKGCRRPWPEQHVTSRWRRRYIRRDRVGLREPDTRVSCHTLHYRSATPQAHFLWKTINFRPVCGRQGGGGRVKKSSLDPGVRCFVCCCNSSGFWQHFHNFHRPQIKQI